MSDDPEDQKYFREQMAGVRKLAGKHEPLERPKPRPRARFAREDEQQVLRDSLTGEPGIDFHEEIAFARPGITPSMMKKLRRGKYSIGDELDLHGLNVMEAKSILSAFIVDCQMLGHRCVRIIHGKGTRSGSGGPVLKPRVYRWLRRSDAILAYTTARQNDGGSGALYVLLR